MTSAGGGHFNPNYNPRCGVQVLPDPLRADIAYVILTLFIHKSADHPLTPLKSYLHLIALICKVFTLKKQEKIYIYIKIIYIQI